MSDPATQRRPGRNVPRMRPNPPCSRPPTGYVCNLTDGHTGPCPAWPAADMPTATAVVTVTVALRPGQDFPDVHVAAANGRTWLAALDAAMTAATSGVPAGVPFSVSSMRRR